MTECCQAENMDIPKVEKCQQASMENGSVRLLPQDQEKAKLEDDKLLGAPRVYKRRWLMLTLFVFYSMSNAIQWIHLNIISNVMLSYYNESLPGEQYQKEVAIDWLSMIYMFAYVPLIFPATWLLEKKGLRIPCILGSFLNCLGAWIKCASVGQDRFAVLMFGQTICAIAQIWVLGIPAYLAAVWFGPNEVSTATSIGVFGNQVGVAIGFLVPPAIVPTSQDLDQVGHDLSIMFYGMAAITTVIFIIIVLLFKKEPPQPPSRAQQLAIEATKHTDYSHSLKRLVKNKGFMNLVVTYGLNTGSYYAISTLLNPIVLSYFVNAEKDAGRIGLTMVLAGVLGAIVAGIWLDKTKSFKGTTVGIYVFSLLGMVAFTATMDLSTIWILFVTSGALGLFMTGYLPVGFEFAAEITHPEPEGTSSGLLNASAQIVGIIMTLSMRVFMNKVSTLAANITMSCALLVGVILTAFIKPDYRRQRAGETVYAAEATVSNSAE